MDSVAYGPWNGTLDATKFGPGCPQLCNLPPHTCPQTQSEDCLTLNIYTPPNITSDLLPVVFYIPGGRFEQGASDTYLYDGRYIVQHNVILVTTNYRLGALGFLYLEGEANGSFGIGDQRLGKSCDYCVILIISASSALGSKEHSILWRRQLQSHH